MRNPLTQEMIEQFRREFENDSHANSMYAAAARTEIKDLVFLPMEAAKLNGPFSVEIKTRGITAQEKSGRCWMFSALNILREKVAEKYRLNFFEFSENYLAFYDKLEKSNNLLEMTIENASKPLSDRKMEYIIESFWDGGLWPMAVNLIEKYGLVPKSAMPETYQSSHTEKFMRLLKTLLKKDMAELRKMIAEGKDPSKRKEEMMGEIFKAECICFGMPPETFHFEYRDKDGVFYSDRNLSPKEFYEKYVGTDLSEYVFLINEPTDLKKFHTLYQYHKIGNMAEHDIRILNLPMDEIKELCIAQLKDGEPVFFGCDSGAYGDRTEGIWDIDSFDYSGIFGGADLFMNKKDRLELKDSYPSHNMILVGVNLDENGKPDRWKIENSWGKEAGKEGYFVCSDRYFEEYVYEAVILKKYLNSQSIEALEKEPVLIEPWQI